MASDGYHEPISDLDEGVVDRHRAIRSVMEELEAVDWYDQRVSATSDPTLAAVLAHNRDEEKEHAAMGIEWLRRNDATFDEQLRTYLFTDGPITGVEAAAMGRDVGGGHDDEGGDDGGGHDDEGGDDGGNHTGGGDHHGGGGSGGGDGGSGAAGPDGSLRIGSLKDDIPGEGSA
jgi:ferritin-like protein